MINRKDAAGAVKALAKAGEVMKARGVCSHSASRETFLTEHRYLSGSSLKAPDRQNQIRPFFLSRKARSTSLSRRKCLSCLSSARTIGVCLTDGARWKEVI